MHDTQCIMGLSSWNLQVFLPWSQFYSSSCQHYIWTAGGGTVPNLSCVTEMTTVRMRALTDLIWNRAVRAPRSLNFWLTGIISCPHWLHWPLYLKLWPCLIWASLKWEKWERTQRKFADLILTEICSF